MARLVEIDGSYGEGGGQILRTAVGLSAVLGVPVRVYNIRAKRRNPGLRPQHFTAIRVLQAITGAKVKGLAVGSREIVFEPGPIRAGSYSFDIGTAGSISLLLQAVLPVLAYAPGPVKLRVKGGTDVKMAPLIDYVRFVLVPLISKLGYNVKIVLIRRGHYPRGGGIVDVEVSSPPRRLDPVRFTVRGSLLKVEGLSHCVRLPPHVAERQARAASRIIREELGVDPQIRLEYYRPGEDPHLGPGSGIVLWAVFENSVMGADSLGEKGVRAEIVGERAARRLVEDIATGASLDRHASDMIPVYMALACGVSEYSGSILTGHAKTVFWLLERMVEGVEITVEGLKPFHAQINGVCLRR